MKDWKLLSHVRCECRYHIVFVSKFRQKTIAGKARKKLSEGGHLSPFLICDNKMVNIAGVTPSWYTHHMPWQLFCIQGGPSWKTAKTQRA